MQDFLMMCYFSGMTINESRIAYAKNYGKEISQKSIETAKTRIANDTGKTWQ